MRLLSCPLVLLACALVVAATDRSVQTSAEQRNADIGRVQEGIDAANKLADIFNSDIFEGTPIHAVAELVSKTLSFVSAIIGLFMGGEDPMVRYLRQQFALVNAKLDRIALDIQDVKRLIEWTTARGMYAQYEIEIATASRLYNDMLNADAPSKEFKKNQFIDYFRPRKFAALKLHEALLNRDLILAMPLSNAVVMFTQNHRRQVTSFLLAMSRLVLRGAQLEISFHSLTDSNAGIVQRDWDARMRTLTYAMKATEDSVKSASRHQMVTDTRNFHATNSALSHRDFADQLYAILVDKYDWQYWIVVSYKPVTKTSSHALSSHQGTRVHFPYNRNVVLGRADKRTSTWSKARAEKALEDADKEHYGTSDATFWNGVINKFYPVNGRDVTLCATICYGCSPTVAAPESRFAQRKITGKNKNRIWGILFG